jgi:hypothetical protein
MPQPERARNVDVNGVINDEYDGKMTETQYSVGRMRRA